jgi:NDP-sugar pyrophosphorylase family protein
MYLVIFLVILYMIICCHRINTLYDLNNVPTTYGIEVDLRDHTDGTIYISHDPFVQGEPFDIFLQVYAERKHVFIILNIKSEGIEYRVLDLLKKHNIVNYFFLDSSFPMIYKLHNIGEKNCAVRFSELEGLDTVLSMKNKINWVWIDCFTRNPLTKEKYMLLKDAGFKLCFVSPELQQQPEKIDLYINYFKHHGITLDMVCTKSYNAYKWDLQPQLPQFQPQLIIPMSGMGQRFIDAGYTTPKPLITVDGHTIIEHVVNLFPQVCNIKFICNEQHLATTNMRKILNSIRPEAKIYEIAFAHLGPVHAVNLIKDDINDDQEVIVSYCDYGTKWDYNEFLKDTRDRHADGAVVCYKGFHPHMLGTDNYAFLKETDRWMDSIQEKRPFTDNRMNEYASNGTYYFRSGAIMKKYFQQLIDQQIKVNNEYYVSMVYNLMVNDKLNVSIFEIKNMLQWGTPNDLEIYQRWSNYFRNLSTIPSVFVDNNNTTTVLPLAGRGDRFLTKGYTCPKPLINVTNKPMVIQAVDCLPPSSEYIFICLNEHIEKYDLLDKLKHYKNTIVVPINETTQGQACTCELGLQHFDMEKSILISACDNGVSYDVDKYQRMVDDKSIDVIVWSFRNHSANRNNPDMYAWMETDVDNNIKHVSCKKFDKDRHDIKTSHTIVGTIFYRKAKYFIDGLQRNYKNNIRSNNEFYVDDVINRNIEDGLTVKVFEVDNYVCWGTPDDYETFIYWQKYFHEYDGHPYRMS